jgi:hypothetical protein
MRCAYGHKFSTHADWSSRLLLSISSLCHSSKVFFGCHSFCGSIFSSIRFSKMYRRLAMFAPARRRYPNTIRSQLLAETPSHSKNPPGIENKASSNRVCTVIINTSSRSTIFFSLLLSLKSLLKLYGSKFYPGAQH